MQKMNQVTRTEGIMILQSREGWRLTSIVWTIVKSNGLSKKKSLVLGPRLEECFI